MNDIIAHTMEYIGDGDIHTSLVLRKYTDSDFSIYKTIYEDCFWEMRTALKLTPVNCCDTKEQLNEKKDNIYIYEEKGEMIGSVAIYGNEIDDLIVSKKYQKKGYGNKLLIFAINRMQQNNIAPIILHVADWNKEAIKIYLNNGFKITKTQIIKRHDE